MNKLIIDGTEYELEVVGVSNTGAIPYVSINGKTYSGLAIPNKPAKDYEILEGMHPEGHEVGQYAHKWQDGSDDCKTRCSDNGCKIHSIKRLSDGQVFTVGDEINYGINKEVYFKIKSFSFDDRGGLFVNEGSLYGAFCRLSHWIKKPVRKPLFTTEDGVEVFEGGECWVLGKEGGEPCKWIRVCKEGMIYYYKYFSTQQAAQLYVLQNKQCLSYMDMLNFTDAIQHADLMKYVEKKVTSSNPL